MRKLPDWTKILIPIVMTALCIIISASIILAGYIVPATRNDGYTVTTCQCGRSFIYNTTSMPPVTIYTGIAYLTFQSPHLKFTYPTSILSSESCPTVEAYLNLNYRENTTVICYVNTVSRSIIVTVFNTYLALGFCIVFVLLSVFFFILSVACCCSVRRRRRLEYIDLDRKNRTEQLATDVDWSVPIVIK